MANELRKILFYQLAMYMNGHKKETLIDLTEMEVMFNKIIEEQMKEINGSDNKAMAVEVKDGDYVMEVVKRNLDEHIYYIKLGAHNPTNSVAIRDKYTLKTDGIEIGKSQSLEIYTLCVIDFKTGVISYVKMNGSARVSIIKDVLNKSYADHGYETRLSVICTPDVIEALSRKKRILKINMDLAVPSDAELERIGVSEPTFDGVRGIKTKTLSFEVTADRGKTLFDEPGMIKKGISKILSSVNEEHLKKVTASAKDDGEAAPQVFNLLLEGVTMREHTEKKIYDESNDI